VEEVDDPVNGVDNVDDPGEVVDDVQKRIFVLDRLDGLIGVEDEEEDEPEEVEEAKDCAPVAPGKGKIPLKFVGKHPSQLTKKEKWTKILEKPSLLSIEILAVPWLWRDLPNIFHLLWYVSKL